METTVIQLYSKGITTAKIAELIEQMYGPHYSPTEVSNITKVMAKKVESFTTRKLTAEYVAVYLDAIYINLKRDTPEKEAVHIAIGIKSDGTKEIIGYMIAPNEAEEVWNELLQGIKKQGVKQVLLFISDGVVGLENVLTKNFSKVKQQRCLVHLSRNICSHVRVSDRSEIMNDFKLIHPQKNKDSLQEILLSFTNKWESKYLKLTKKNKRSREPSDLL